jgi:hypothetical protein
MNYLDIAGIKHGVETDIEFILPHRENITMAFKAAVESCYKHGTSLPANLKKNGERMVRKPESARALMVFLRACARLEGAAILCRKRGILKGGRQTTQSLYTLLM